MRTSTMAFLRIDSTPPARHILSACEQLLNPNSDPVVDMDGAVSIFQLIRDPQWVAHELVTLWSWTTAVEYSIRWRKYGPVVETLPYLISRVKDHYVFREQEIISLMGMGQWENTYAKIRNQENMLLLASASGPNDDVRRFFTHRIHWNDTSMKTDLDFSREWFLLASHYFRCGGIGDASAAARRATAIISDPKCDLVLTACSAEEGHSISVSENMLKWIPEGADGLHSLPQYLRSIVFTDVVYMAGRVLEELGESWAAKSFYEMALKETDQLLFERYSRHFNQRPRPKD